MRSLIAVLAGGIVAAALFQLGALATFLAVYGLPLGASPRPTGSYFALNLGCSAIAAMAAGWVTARLARRRRLAHVAVLAFVLAAGVLWGFTRPASQWPRWYPLALALVGVAGSLAGGLLHRGRASG